ncbi:hypothetical protein Tco_0717404, partial [Tanacetum coccineum]
RCNNYDVLQSIPCSSECKIIGQILLDHPLSYALTATVDVLVWPSIREVLAPTMEDPVQGVVEGGQDEESYASKFAASMLHDDVDDFGNRIEPGSHKEHPKVIDDENMWGVKDISSSFIGKSWTADQFWTCSWKELIVLHEIVPQLVERATNDLIESNLKPIVADTFMQEWDAFQSEVPILISKEFDAHAPKIIEIFSALYDAAEEKDNDDQTDHTLVRIHATGSMETRNDQIQTPIPTPTRSPRKDLSLDKTISEELKTPVSPTTATTSKSKNKRGFTSNKTKILPGSIAGIEVLDHCNNVVPELTFSKTNEIIKEEMPRLVKLAVQKDQEIASTSVPELISKEFATHGLKMIEELFRKHMQNTTVNLYPTSSTPSSSTATMSTTDLQYQLYLNMKSKYQDQATDLDIWEILNFFLKSHKFLLVTDFSLIMMNNIRMLILLKGHKRVKKYFDNYKTANEKVRIFCEWKINSSDDEASIIINPKGEIVRFKKSVYIKRIGLCIVLFSL